MNKVFAENSSRKITFRKTVNLYLSLLLSPWACRRVCPTSHFENLSVTVLLTIMVISFFYYLYGWYSISFP